MRSIRKKLLISTVCIIILYIFVIITINTISALVNNPRRIFASRLNVIKTPKINYTPTLKEMIRYTTTFRTLHIITENDTSCYNKTSDTNGFMELDYSTGKEAPKLGRSIFFHETSCFGDEGLLLNARQACAVESAAKMNPNMSVYLLYLSPSKISKFAYQMIHQLLTYENIKIRRIHIENYMETTPLSEWYSSGILKTSYWPRNHMSDILRYLTLWKYGGIYLDLDVVVIKSLEDLENFTGAQDGQDVAAGVLGFGMGELGRKMANATIKDLKDHFRGWAWGNNGPGVITRALQDLCKVKNARNMTKSQCQGFDVFPPPVFYPIFYPSWRKYFVADNDNRRMKIIEQSKVIHVWNKYSKSERVKIGSNVPYAKIAEKYCPKVYHNCGEIF